MTWATKASAAAVVARSASEEDEDEEEEELAFGKGSPRMAKSRGFCGMGSMG